MKRKFILMLLSSVMVIGFLQILSLRAGAEAFADWTYIKNENYMISNKNTVIITKYNGNGKNVKIPADIDGMLVTGIGEGAFSNNFWLTSVTIPDSVTSIGDGAFSNCYYLTSVTIPNSVTSIGGGTFSNCYYLTSVTIPNSVTSIGDGTFSNCYYLTSVTIPNSVISIGDGAFSNCYYLVSVTIPNSVTSIGENAFKYCFRMTEVTFKPTYPPSLELSGSVFFGCDLLKKIYVPVGAKASYSAALIGYDFKIIEVHVMLGDCNNDDKININDLKYMKRFLMGKPGITRNSAMDLNSDGRVNIADLTYLKRLLVKAPEFKSI
ncbi:MAG: leucine-rich repeat protein [Eubacterium sp.]|jgi:hypothetical protein|nr:leucine-rich repeat protein [Eubacterium sp.]